MDQDSQVLAPVVAGRTRRNEEIEVLRALAVSMVFVEHMPLNLFYWRSHLGELLNAYWHGTAGVDLFFAISGFVIARTLLPRLAGCREPIAYLSETFTFLLHRFWRLQPSAWLWIAVPVILSVVFNRSGAFRDLQSNLASGFAGILAVSDFRFGQLLPGQNGGMNFHYWSLSLEEQFYLVLPALFYLLRRRIVYVMGLLVVWQFLLPPEAIFIYTRAGGIGLGVLVAIWSARPGYALAEPAFLGRSAVVRWVFLIFMVAALGALSSNLPQPLFGVPIGLVAVLSGVLVYTATFDKGYIMRPGALRSVLVWVGSRSYAIYLIHIPAFALTREYYFRYGAPIWKVTVDLELGYFFTALAVTLILSELNYRFVETPLRQYGRRLFVGPGGTRKLPRTQAAGGLAAEISRLRVAIQARPTGLLPFLCPILLASLAILMTRAVLGFQFPVPWPDETSFITPAFNLTNAGTMFVSGLNPDRVVMWMPPGYMVFLAGIFSIFGYSFALVRWVSTLLVLGALVLLSRLAWRTTHGMRRWLAGAAIGVAFASPYMLASSNIGRMEALLCLMAIAALSAALSGRLYVAASLIAAAGVVHFNAIYFVPAMLAVFADRLWRRTLPWPDPRDWLAMAAASACIGAYALYALAHWPGLQADMHMQFAAKAFYARLDTDHPTWLFLLASALAVLRLALVRRIDGSMTLALFGVGFVAVSHFGHEIWYDFALPLGFCLLALAWLQEASSFSRAGWTRYAAAFSLLLTLASAFTLTPQMAHLRPHISMLTRSLISSGEMARVHWFAATLPAGATVDFGFSGMENFFLADLAQSGATWNMLNHSVTEPQPWRKSDWSVLCNSRDLPPEILHYRAAEDAVPADTGCRVTHNLPDASGR